MNPETPSPPPAPADGPSPFAARLLVLFMILEFVRPPLLHEIRLPMIVVVTLLALWLAAKKKPWSGILTAQVLFFLLCLQAVPWANNYFVAFVAARALFGYVTIALALSWLLATRESFRSVTWVWLLIMGYVAVYGIAHGGVGPGDFLGDENDLALGCATAFPFAFYGFERLSGARRLVCGAICGLLVVAIVVSFSRGGFIALVVVGVYCWFASRHKVRALVTVAVAVSLLVVVAPDQGRTGESYIERLRSMFNTEEGTAEGRRFLWATARNMWKANPVLGVGAGNFAFLVGRYQPTDWDKPEFLERDWSGTVTHSVYFQILAEHGTAGALLFGYIVWSHFMMLRRARRRAAAHQDLPPHVRRDIDMYGGALGGAVVGYLAAGAFVSVAYYPYLWYFTGMAVALDHMTEREIGAAGARSGATRVGRA